MLYIGLLLTIFSLLPMAIGIDIHHLSFDIIF